MPPASSSSSYKTHVKFDSQGRTILKDYDTSKVMVFEPVVDERRATVAAAAAAVVVVVVVV
jgi:hypothetical protein